MRPILVAIALLASLIVSVLVATPAQAAPAAQRDYVSTVVTTTNAARARHERRALRVDACLRAAAQGQARTMARQGRLFHSTDFGTFGRRCGLTTWGENVAQAPGSDGGRGVVTRQWMRSSGHRANILSRSYRQIGVGAVRARGAWWVVQVFGRPA